MDDKVTPTSTSPCPAIAGAATPCPWLHRSTREVPAGERFEFCRALALGAHAERPLDRHADFFGEFTYTAAPDGTGFAEIDIDPCVSRFGPGGDDSMVDIGVVGAGTMHLSHGRDERLVLDADAGPLLFDAARPMTAWTTRTALAMLRLPRAAVVAALDGDAVPRANAMRLLPPDALTAEFAACLRSLRDAAAHAIAAPRATLATTRALALVSLAHFRGAQHRWPAELGVALYRAACHLLAMRVGDPRVTADEVAQVLGCSRAQLYRCFAMHGDPVAGYLHNIRMQRAAVLLRTEPEAPIGMIALRCGYAESAAFDKAFRRRFRMAPRDWRAETMTPVA